MALLWREHTLTLLFGEAGTTDADFLTYDETLSYVRVDVAVAAVIEGSPAPVGAVAVVERSVDLITWVRVRGGRSVPLSASTRPLIDSEFTANAQNFYRISVYDEGELFHTFRDDVEIVLDVMWLKFPRTPFLNRPITVIGPIGDQTRGSRSGVFDVVGRALPVAVVDRHSSRQFDLNVMVPTPILADELDAALSSGQLVYLSGPPDMPYRPGHYLIGDMSMGRRSLRGARRYFSLPLTRVAPATADATGVLFTWRALAQRYATWDDVMAAHATWQEVRELVGSPSDVEVI